MTVTDREKNRNDMFPGKIYYKKIIAKKLLQRNYHNNLLQKNYRKNLLQKNYHKNLLQKISQKFTTIYHVCIFVVICGILWGFGRH